MAQRSLPLPSVRVSFWNPGNSHEGEPQNRFEVSVERSQAKNIEIAKQITSLITGFTVEQLFETKSHGTDMTIFEALGGKMVFFASC